MVNIAGRWRIVIVQPNDTEARVAVQIHPFLSRRRELLCYVAREPRRTRTLNSLALIKAEHFRQSRKGRLRALLHRRHPIRARKLRRILLIIQRKNIGRHIGVHRNTTPLQFGSWSRPGTPTPSKPARRARPTVGENPEPSPSRQPQTTQPMHASFVGTDRQTDRDGPDLSRVLTPATTVKLLDDLKAGRPVKIGPQNATGSIDISTLLIHSFIHRGERERRVARSAATSLSGLPQPGQVVRPLPRRARREGVRK